VLDRIRSGDREALGLLYAEHAPRLLRVAWRLVGNRADAEDVLHDLFVGLPAALERYRDQGRLSSWLVQCITRASLMRLRAVQRRREEAMPLVDRFIAASRPDLAPELLELEQRLAALPVALRTVLLLRQIEGLTHAEIADTLGISEGNSRIRLARALEQLNAARPVARPHR
jgi:RNA polymerase sigma-70 factor (ECF subfamily)